MALLGGRKSTWATGSDPAKKPHAQIHCHFHAHTVFLPVGLVIQHWASWTDVSSKGPQEGPENKATLDISSRLIFIPQAVWYH